KQIAFQREREFCAVIMCPRCRRLVETISMALERQRQTEEIVLTAEKTIAQIKRSPLPVGLVAVDEASHGADFEGRKRRADLDPEISDRHELDFELLAKRLVGSGLFGEPP